MALTQTEVAEKIVALASTPVAKSASEAEPIRQAINAAVKRAVADSDSAWAQAAEDAIRHVLLVAANNPNKSPEQILARPDVQQAFRQPFEDAAEQTRAAVDAALERGWALGGEQAAQTLEGMGLHGYDLELESDLRDSVLADVDRNMRSSLDRLSEAFADPATRQERLAVVGRDLQRRSKYSVEYALRRAAEERRAREYAIAGVGLMWVSRLAENTCSFCLALHGKVVAPGESFPVDPKLKVYKDLKAPPRHPNCQCVVVPVPWKSVSAQTREDAAQAESAAIQKAVQQGREPKSISSDALRKMPRSFLPKLVLWLMKWLTKR